MKNARGTLDYDSLIWEKKKQIENTVLQEIRLLDTTEISTPCLETTSLLLDKYGEEAESKLIFHLQSRDDSEKGEKTSLRYDHTVPLMRYLTCNGIESGRFLHSGKVFREDKPYPKQGRFCEFSQVDLDVIGEYPEMVWEAEILQLVARILAKLDIPTYQIKINFRQNLKALILQAGIREELFIPVATILDKLDKISWEKAVPLFQELKIGEESIATLHSLTISQFIEKSCVEKLGTLMSYLPESIHSQIKFDACLARGLDYYTGLIYEVVIPDSHIGTIIAGGRYDNLICKKKKKKTTYFPAIGISFGIDRITLVAPDSIVTDKLKIKIVATKGNLPAKMKLATFLRENGFRVTYPEKDGRVDNQINRGIKDNYHYIVILGEDGEQIKLKSNDQEPDILVTQKELLDKLVYFNI